MRKKLRLEIRSRRQNLTAEEQHLAEQKLLSQLIKLPEILAAKIIAIYLSNDGELATDAFIEWCWTQGKTVCLPVLHPFSKGHLLFLNYQKNTTLVKNKYGINEPILTVQNVVPFPSINIVFTPLVAFDNAGARLGMGGGFYDRTLSSWYKSQKSGTGENNTTMLPIGLAHDCQKVTNIPSECWDIPIPLIVTPSQTITFF